MQSFAALKRRSTEIYNSLPSLPSLPTLPARQPHATWERLSDIPELPRSSHSVNVVDGSVYVFGGELKPREPVDNDMHVIRLPYSGCPADYYPVHAESNAPVEDAPVKAAPAPVKEELTDDEGSAVSDAESDVPLTPAVDKGKGKVLPDSPLSSTAPVPRVGHATAVIGSRIFLFGGRGGPAMAPIEENGRVWVFDTRSNRWSFLDPVSPIPGPDAIIPQPAARSYHAAAAVEIPRDFSPPGLKRRTTWAEWAAGDSAEVGTPQAPLVGNIAEKAIDKEEDGFGTFIIHGGCLAGAGERANDVWAFDIHSRIWQQLPLAPGAARGGAALTVSGNRLFRFGGYDGKGEIGGRLDVLELGVDTSGLEPVIAAKGEWLTYTQPLNADGRPRISQPWPKARSVTQMVPLNINGTESIVLFMGEGEASSLGHAGAGKFFDDVWVLQVPASGAPVETELRWSLAVTEPRDEDSHELPVPRGWLSAAPIAQVEDTALVMFGGLTGDNKRCGDGWILRFE